MGSRPEPGWFTERGIMDRMEAAERAFLESARTATLATIAPDGVPRLVPICFVVGDDEPGP